MLDPALYFDHSATTPPHPQVILAMQQAMQEAWGNPSSLHGWGERAALALETARWQVADLIGADPSRIIFTSGGSESNNLALRGMAEHWETQQGSPGHLVISAVEHSSVSQAAAALAQKGWRVTRIPVTSTGEVTPEALERALSPETCLVSIVHGQNEVGTLQPISALAQICRQQGILFHTDAVQTVGKVPLSVETLGIDGLSLSGHKFYGPQGVGALYVREGILLTPQIVGGGQEGGWRSGTQALPAIVGLGVAAALAQESLPSESLRLRALQQQLHQSLQDIQTLVLLGSPEMSQRLPHHLSYGVRGQLGREIVQQLSRQGIGISAGSACHRGQATASATLLAMGIPVDLAQGGIRFSLGRDNTSESVQRLSQALRSLLVLGQDRRLKCSVGLHE